MISRPHAATVLQLDEPPARPPGSPSASPWLRTLPALAATLALLVLAGGALYLLRRYLR
ncbi:MAG: hypothetical protein R3B70_14980 [Polyangiaceae bacterium]